MRKLLVPLILVLGLVGPLFGLNWYTFGVERAQIQDSFTGETKRIAETLANGVSDPVWNLIPSAGSAIVRSLMRDPRIVRIEVFGENGGLFLAAGNPPADAGAAIMQTATIMHEDATIGTAKVYFSDASLRDALAANWEHHLEATFLQFVFAVLIGAFVLRLNTKFHSIKHSEDAAKVEQKFIQALDNIPVSIALFDADDRFVLGNRAWWEDMPIAREALKPDIRFEDILKVRVEKEMIPVEAEGDGEAWIRHRLEQRRNAPVMFEARFGDDWLQIMDLNLPDGGTLSVGSNITELKELEERLRAAHRLEAIGQMTGGVAHDFNNILSVLMGNLEFLEDAVEPGSEEHDIVTMMSRAVDRGSSLTSRLLSYSRRQVLAPENVHLVTYIDGLEELLKRTLGETIVLNIDHAPTLWPVTIDPHELENAVVNLAVNARDAMSDGGRLEIETENVTLDDRRRHGAGCPRPGP
jgi:nitrogen-specific signal transduction histidine kinase